MNLAFLKFDFPDLEPHEALWLITEDLEAAAYHLKDGQIVGVRNPKLSALYIDLRLQALLGMHQASRKNKGRDPEQKGAEAEQKRRRG